MNDLISRQAAIDVASGYCHPANIAKELAKLPSAQPEQHGVCMDCAIRNVCKFKSCLGDYGYCSQWTKIEVE